MPSVQHSERQQTIHNILVELQTMRNGICSISEPTYCPELVIRTAGCEPVFHDCPPRQLARVRREGVDGLCTHCEVEYTCSNLNCSKDYHKRSKRRIQLHDPDCQIVLGKDVCEPIPTTSHYRWLLVMPSNRAINPIKQHVSHDETADYNLLLREV